MKWTTYTFRVDVNGNKRKVVENHYKDSGVKHNPPCSTEKCKRKAGKDK